MWLKYVEVFQQLQGCYCEVYSKDSEVTAENYAIERANMLTMVSLFCWSLGDKIFALFTFWVQGVSILKFALEDK